MPHNILVVQTAFIGDVILTIPLIKAVKKKFSGSKLSVLVIPQSAELLKNNPYVDEVITYDKRGQEKSLNSFFQLVNRIKQSKFDLALVPHRSYRSSFLVFLSKIPERIGFDKNQASFFLTKKIVYQKNWHEIDRNLSLIESDGLSVEEKYPELFPTPEDFGKVERFLAENKINADDVLIAIAPGSTWATKRWIEAGFAKVADWLIQKEKMKVVFTGSREDEQLMNSIYNLMEVKPVNACGKLSLLESAALLSKCKLLLANDTAPVHMAVAMKTPVVEIYGSTVPAFGFYPYGDGHLIIEKNLPCRPCGIHGHQKCPLGHFKCMKEISPEEVYQAVTKKLTEF
ncbi:MAG: lipopolysaccharide heptosyltransferase II [candidate division Zixibacteria bacterium RBG_16_40_9]|nr:MAG: lipopolysaccharide heptosyltransferase II [candidate division Zixibacteria bacterium RBG_16_40_9]